MSTIVPRLCAAGLLCAVLAACAGETSPAPGTGQQAALPPDDAVRDEAGPAEGPAVWPRPPQRPAVSAGFAVDPEALLNLAETDLRAQMGAPALVRDEPPAVVWTYAQGDCRLDVYLYQSVKTRELRSLTYVLEAADGADGDADPAATCLRQGE